LRILKSGSAITHREETLCQYRQQDLPIRKISNKSMKWRQQIFFSIERRKLTKFFAHRQLHLCRDGLHAIIYATFGNLCDMKDVRHAKNYEDYVRTRYLYI